tara:strand:- start:19 stop:249 length:231 start_codon:yes stop_codon:yes gene_type:complete
MLSEEESSFRKLDEKQMLEIRAQLELLERQVSDFNNLRESLTRELVVNNVKDGKELNEKIKKVFIQEDLDVEEDEE